MICKSRISEKLYKGSFSMDQSVFDACWINLLKFYEIFGKKENKIFKISNFTGKKDHKSS